MNYKYPDLKQGFTLVELLVATAIMGIVITLTGGGLYALMNANQRSQSETINRLELEQALAFISDEIKMAGQISPNIPTTSFSPAAGSSRVQPILILNPATNSKLTKPIIYYLADPPNQSVWLGPRVIYRWGPTLLQNGKYSDGNGRDIDDNLASPTIEYYNEVVVDRMSEIPSPAASTNCDSGYDSAVPTIDKRLGFYVCISVDRKSVKLWLNKQPNSSGKSQSLEALVRTRAN